MWASLAQVRLYPFLPHGMATEPKPTCLHNHHTTDVHYNNDAVPGNVK